MSTSVRAPRANAVFEEVPCYSCGARSRSVFLEALDDLSGRPGMYRFVRCDGCGLVYQNPRLTLAAIREHYDDDYLAYRRRRAWGPLEALAAWGMNRVDAKKEQIVLRQMRITRESAILDVGCGAGGFLSRMRWRHGASVTGVDFKDLSGHPWMKDVDFRCGLFGGQRFGDRRFDLITMWHYLEHDYDPARSLAAARELLARDGRLVVEVPRLDSLTFRLFRERWPGVQAPQHTVLFDKEHLLGMLDAAGLELVEYLPYGAFPAYFYLFTGAAFTVLNGRGLDMQKAVLPYFAGQLALAPLLAFEKKLNLAMQTVVCRAEGSKGSKGSRGSRGSRVQTSKISWGVVSRCVVSGLFVVALSGLMALVGALTLFRARRFYAETLAKWGARVVLSMWGIRLAVHESRHAEARQVVYISNHSSTLDIFILIALGLPRTRYFMSASKRRIVPLGIIADLIGTIWTVPQDRPDDRIRIFQRAERLLRRTGDSVYLSPEGGRVVTGQIGAFNKGAFHLATNLRTPIVPFYVAIPRQADPGNGYRARPCTVHVFVQPAIETSRWRREDLERNTAVVRDLFVKWHRQYAHIREAS